MCGMVEDEKEETCIREWGSGWVREKNNYGVFQRVPSSLHLSGDKYTHVCRENMQGWIKKNLKEVERTMLMAQIEHQEFLFLSIKVEKLVYIGPQTIQKAIVSIMNKIGLRVNVLALF